MRMDAQLRREAEELQAEARNHRLSLPIEVAFALVVAFETKHPERDFEALECLEYTRIIPRENCELPGPRKTGKRGQRKTACDVKALQNDQVRFIAMHLLGSGLSLNDKPRCWRKVFELWKLEHPDSKAERHRSLEKAWRNHGGSARAVLLESHISRLTSLIGEYPEHEEGLTSEIERCNKALQCPEDYLAAPYYDQDERCWSMMVIPYQTELRSFYHGRTKELKKLNTFIYGGDDL